jgi:hypothetical protein
MTDLEADKILDNARAMLRLALQGVMQGHEAQVLTIAQQPLPNGEKWPIKVVILSAPLAALVDGLLAHGLPAMFKTYEQLKGVVGPNGATPGATPKGFSVPGA